MEEGLGAHLVLAGAIYSIGIVVLGMWLGRSSSWRWRMTGLVLLLAGPAVLFLGASSGLFGSARYDLPLAEIGRAGGGYALALFGGLLLASAVFLMTGAIRHRSLTLPLVVAAPAIFIVILATALATCDCATAPPIDEAARTLPPGFAVEELVGAGTLGSASSMAMSPEGDLFVGTASGIVRLRMDDERVETTTFSPEASVLGLAYHDGYLYASPPGKVVRIEDRGPDEPGGAPSVVVDDLPAYVYSVHANNGLAFDEKDNLYIAVGGTSDAGPELHPWGGTILIVDLDDPGGGAYVFARGLRNAYDLAFCPDGELFAGDNGPTPLAPGDPAPHDELNHIEAGGDYGYPDFFENPPPWSETAAPMALLPVRSVPTGIICYEDGVFPERYSGTLFLSLYGADHPDGAEPGIVTVTIREEDGYLVGEWTRFLSGVAHPVDLEIDAEGRLLILEYETGRVLRVGYEGDEL